MTRYQMIQNMFPAVNACAYFEERCETLTAPEVAYAFNTWKVNHSAGVAVLTTLIEKAKTENRTARPFYHR